MAGESPFAWQVAVAAAMPALLSAALTAAWIGWARRRNVVDAPGQRRLHLSATPRGGGVGMAVVLLLSLAALDFSFVPRVIADSGIFHCLVGVFAGLAIATATGMADDLLSMPSAFKFAGQMAAALIIAFCLPWPGVPLVLGVGLSFAWTLVLVNFWNFMDGSNGMVAVQTLVVALALFVLGDGPGAAFAWVLAAACLGFLPFNLPKARVFMGDTGSHVLGATVAILTLWTLRAGDAGLGQVLLLLSAFGLDAGLTLGKRIVQGRRFWRAHREHLYQFAVRRGHSHARVCLAYAAWAILCGWFAIGLDQAGADLGIAAAAAVWLLGATAWVLLRRHWLKRETRMDAPA
jgi:UDP-N-acetylmuramyl pentapeptide phosphotransferase/UDP-N-acetylglucosamine-1-phosphate transferase